MANKFEHDPVLDLFLFETTQFIEQLEQLILINEKASSYSSEVINEIFRIMHTIKGSSAMMHFNNISTLAHSIEDVFFLLREDKPQNVDYSVLSDYILEGLDFIKVEIAKIQNGDEADGNAAVLIKNLQNFLAVNKKRNSDREIVNYENNTQPKEQYYINKIGLGNKSLGNIFQANLYFEDGCGMENLRAFGVINDLKGVVEEYYCLPEDLDNDDSAGIIREQGFTVIFQTTLPFDNIERQLMQTVFLKNLELKQVHNEEVLNKFSQDRSILSPENSQKTLSNQNQQSIISVSVAKLDQLMDLVGEMVIAEAMVTQNPDLKGLELNNFNKAARQLRKITSELQDTVMSVRMVPLAATFQKMNRTVRDMCKRLNKEVQLHLIGEETEVDKNIIEHIADPLMHLIRNAIDHGIETSEERVAKGKPKMGTITLEAKNAGGYVLVIIKDDGKGFNKKRILAKAKVRGLLPKPESEINEREIYNLLFLPGFSTKENVTEFSGRGVGMDVVLNNIEAIGGSISANSVAGKGTTITLKIPLTLAIIDGMNIKVSDSRYTIPLTTIKESFRPKIEDIIIDPDNNEMIMVRGQCFPIIRLHDIYHVKTKVTNFTDGIIIMVEQDNKTFCLFADELLGQQQVVVKALPTYLKNIRKVKGLAGCTLLGDGSISLILDIAGLISYGNSA